MNSYYREVLTRLINRVEIIHYGELIPMLSREDLWGGTPSIDELSDTIEEMAENYELKVVYYSLPSGKYDDHMRVKRILMHPKTNVWIQKD